MKGRATSRITGGRFKGSPLVMPPSLRATEAKVRLALFNILGAFIEGARVLDGFAGSGALGIEALSRGAAFAAFIESEAASVVSIHDNLAKMESDLPREAWRVLHLDVGRGMRELAKSEPPFDLILLDPPYRSDDGKKALITVVEYAMLARGGIVVIEHEHRTILPPSAGPLSAWKRHRYGDTVLSFYRA